jgi:RNA polymerase sigma-70 factor (ECF subfamily)
MVLRAENITTLLQAIREGNRESAERLVRAVYTGLQKVARRYMASERADHTLQPTAIVNEALMRLFRPDSGSGAWRPVDVDWQSRAHFLGIAARQMRLVLIDHAREKRALKRNFGVKVSLEDINPQSAPTSAAYDLEALDQLLDLLAVKDKDAATVIELKFFGGLTDRETAEVMNTNLTKVRRDWEFARLWLRHRLPIECRK